MASYGVEVIYAHACVAGIRLQVVSVSQRSGTLAPPRVNLIAAGLAFWVLSVLLAGAHLGR